MDLIPKFFVAGVLMPEFLAGAKPVTRDALNRIWAEVTAMYPYQGFQLAPGDNGAAFAGAGEEGVTIQPPLMQLRDPIGLDPDHSADKAVSVFRIITRHLGVTQLLNLGIKLIYQAPAPENDATAFVLNRLVRGDEALGELQQGGDLWAGTKFVATQGEVLRILTVEPLQSDTRLLFVDLDVTYQGPITLDDVMTRARDTVQFMTHSVKNFLNGIAQG